MFFTNELLVWAHLTIRRSHTRLVDRLRNKKKNITRKVNIYIPTKFRTRLAVTEIKFP